MIRPLLLVTLLVSSAWAQLPGEGGINVLLGSDMCQDDTNEVSFDASVFGCSADGAGRAQLTTGSLVTLLGQCIGDVNTDFCSTEDHSGRTVDFSAATDLSWPTALILDTHNVGGTAAADNIRISPSSSATGLGTIKLCDNAPDVGTSVTSCAKLYPSGATVGFTGGTNNSFRGISMDAAITQDTDGGIFGYPIIQMFYDSSTLQLTDSALNATYIGNIKSFEAAPTLKNGTDDNITSSLLGIIGFQYAPVLVRTSTGTITVSQGIGFYSNAGSVPASTTYTDLYGLKHVGPATSGTITDHYGSYVSVNTGTNQFPYAAAEAAIVGTVNAGEGIWGVEAGAPNRFYTKNESGRVDRMGYATVTGSGVAMNTGATHYFPINDRLTTTATEGNTDVPVPGALKVMHVACGVDVAPDNGGGAQSWTFTVSADTADVTGTSCAISESATACTASIAAGTAVAAGVMWNFQVVPANTPTATDGSCTVWWNLDAF